jgi:methionyl aminopeptidase
MMPSVSQIELLASWIFVHLFVPAVVFPYDLTVSQDYSSTCQIFSEEHIASLRKGGAILHDCLKHVASLVHPGVTTNRLDAAAEDFIRSHGASPAFKGYHDYPATLCTSVNDVCVHGVPNAKELREGDIVSLDCGVLFDDLYTDSCITVPVGKISDNAQKLLEATQKALSVGISMVHAGVQTGDISSAIHQSLLDSGFDAMRPLTGHGLGDTLHQFPEIPNFGTAGTGPALPAHTIVAIEPISTAGSIDILEDPDKWTLRTKDGALSGHCEHTVLVTKEGCEILT